MSVLGLSSRLVFVISHQLYGKMAVVCCMLGINTTEKETMFLSDGHERLRRNLFHVGISLLGTDPAWLALDVVDVLVFCHSNKMPEANLDRERVYFGSAFWRFQSTVNWFCGFGSVVRNQAMAEYVMEQNKPLTSWLGSK